MDLQNSFSQQVNEILRPQPGAERIMQEHSRQKRERDRREKENNEEIKNIGKLITAIESSNTKSDKLAKRMLYLTIATVILTIVQVVITILKH